MIELTIIDLNNINILVREGYANMVLKNTPAEELESGLITIKKIESAIKFAVLAEQSKLKETKVVQSKPIQESFSVSTQSNKSNIKNK